MSYRIGDWYVYRVESQKEWVARSQDQVHVFSRKKDAVDFAHVQFMIGAK